MPEHIITSDGQVPTYTREIRLEAGGATIGGTAPGTVELVNTRALGFDANDEVVFMTFHVPSDWDGASDFILKVGWYPEDGDPLSQNETCKFNISYNSVAEGEAVDNGTEKSATATYTETGNPGTDKGHIYTEITLTYNDGDQPLTADDDLFIKFYRDFDGDTYTGDAVVLYWELEFTSNTIPKHA